MLASHQIYAVRANPAGTCGEPEPRLMSYCVTSSCVVSSVGVHVIVTWLAATVWQELWWGGSQVALNLFCPRKTTATKSQEVLLTINRKNSLEPPQCIGVALMWSTWVARKHFYLLFFCHHHRCLLLDEFTCDIMLCYALNTDLPSLSVQPSGSSSSSVWPPQSASTAACGLLSRDFLSANAGKTRQHSTIILLLSTHPLFLYLVLLVTPWSRSRRSPVLLWHSWPVIYGQ